MNVSSSVAGRNLAQAAILSYGNKEWESAREIMKDGFESIDRSDLTTTDEKKVAHLGKAVGGHSMSDQDSATARLAVMQALRNGISGPIGQVLAGCAINAYGNKDWEAARSIARDGLKAISDDGTASDQDRAIARLGLTFGSHQMSDQDAATARLAALKEVAYPSSENGVHRIAQATVSAYGNKDWESARAIAKDGLNAVVEFSGATDLQRQEAQMGIVSGGHSMPDEDAARARLSVLKQILSQG